MKKIYLLSLSLISSIIFSQQLTADLHEINYKNGIIAEELFSVGDQILFKGAEVEPYNTPLTLWGYDFNTQKTKQIYNIRPESGSYYLQGNKVFTSLNGKGYFIADGPSQDELWRTDGTNTGTDRIFQFPDNYQIDMTSGEGKILISSNKKIFISDGTSAGTKHLKEMDGQVLEGSAFPYKNYFVFAAKNLNDSNVLWMTDGGSDTFQLKDIENDEILYIHTDLSCYNLNGVLLFYGRTATGSKNGLWAFDNSNKKAKFIATTTGVVHGQIVNGKLIFQGWDSVLGGSLFATDGTAQNTNIISPTMHFLSAMSNQDFMSKLGNYIYFFPSYQNERNRLWKTDGTAAGTVQTDIVIPESGSPEIIKYFPQNERILIENASHNLWWLMDVSETVTPLHQNSLLYAVEYSDKLIFPYSNSKNGQELFQYDFLTNSISLFHDGNRKAGSNPENIILNNQNELIFTADDGENPGNQFYKINSLSAPQRVGLINNSGYGAPVGKLFSVGNHVYVRPDSYTSMLAKSDGTPAQTKALFLPQNNTIDQYSSFGNLNDNALIFTTYYSATDRYIRVWKNNTESNVIELIKEIPTGVNLPNTTKTVSYNGEVYFVVTRPDYKQEIWRTDGTAAGTKVLPNIPDNEYYGNVPIPLTSYDGRLLITKNTKLYSFDSATEEITEIPFPANEWGYGSWNISDHTLVDNGKLYLLSQSGYGNVFKFENLQTPPATLLSDNFMNSFTSFKKCGNQIYFGNGYIENQYNLLWSINATNNSTSQIIANGIGSAASNLTCAKDYLYFLRENSNQIWRTDGSDSGTISLPVSVSNAEQFSADDEILKLLAYENRLYFVARTKGSGKELYEVTTELPAYLNVRNTAAGQENVKLILYPNPASSFIKINDINSAPRPQFRIFDMLGRQVNVGKYNKGESIDISKLNPGTFIMEVTTENGSRYSQKFIKN